MYVYAHVCMYVLCKYLCIYVRTYVYIAFDQGACALLANAYALQNLYTYINVYMHASMTPSIIKKKKQTHIGKRSAAAVLQRYSGLIEAQLSLNRSLIDA
jgi:hypothetical protein